MATLATFVATAALLACAGAAMADSASIRVTAADGTLDPVAYIPRVFTISGSASRSEYLYVKHRPAGGAPCAPTAYSDSGRLSTGFYGVSVSGSYQTGHVWTWDSPGAWTFCMWLASSETAIATPIAQTISFRTPAAQLGVSVSPRAPQVGQPTQITVAGTTEAPRRIWVKLRAASGPPCAQTYDGDPGQSVVDGWDANGSFSANRYTTPAATGQYLICAWLAGSSWDPLPVAGPQALVFKVVPLPPVVSSAAVVRCRTRKPLNVLRAGDRVAVCMRYRFARPPSAGTRLSVAYVTPKRRPYETVTSRWPSTRTASIVTGRLPARAYRHRRGRWRATLRIAGRVVQSTTFRVL